ncbi:glycogen debranching N-terminal domain-containing protein [Arsenicicoccus dermatophilus]|uniref:glycogen debranching N-terminal domain-containing protein n=1 Tax=Arsenicicoccus dermatophilus TaxID=1076331 RepID=UPI0039172460
MARRSEPARQPWLHDLQIAVHGAVTALSERTGAMGPPGTGLLVDDRRALSLLRVRADGEAPDLLTAADTGEQTRIVAALRHLGDPGPDPTVQLHVHRVLDAGGMTERLTLRSRASEPVRTRLEVALAGDDACLPEIKDGRAAGTLLAARSFPSRSPGADPPPSQGDHLAAVLDWSGERHRTTVRVWPPPVGVHPGDGGGPSYLTLALTVPPGGATEVTLRVDVTRTRPSALDADPGADAVDWSLRLTAADGRVAPLVERSLRDLQGLLLRDPLDREDLFVAAGAPWYLTLFGRDSLWTARLLLPVGTDLARGTLRALARRQGRAEDPATGEEPGKILHEVRREQVHDARGRPLPLVYYGSIDATALWVQLLHDAWRHGLADEDVRELAPALGAALGWLARRLRTSPDGLLRYVDACGTGLANQGWKDSGDSMRRADGTLAPPPIALVEAQAYAVAALRGGATLARSLDLTLAAGSGSQILDPAELDRLADDLAERVRRRYTAHDERGTYLVMALDGADRPVDGVGSNMGHVLGTGVLTPDGAAAVAERLVAPDLLMPFGVATLSRDNPGFNPLGYHSGSVWTHDTAIALVGLVREGRTAEAAAVVRALVASGCGNAGRWPELLAPEPVLGRPVPYPASCRPQAWSAAAVGALATGLLGLQVDVPAGRVRLRPLVGLPCGKLLVEGLSYAGRPFAVQVRGDGTVDVTGLPPEVTVDLDGP